MFILGTRQPHIGKTTALSTGVLAALLSALLLLSPSTARAVAQVLAQNGVALPAHVAQVLDALPAKATAKLEEATATVLEPAEPAPDTIAASPVVVVKPVFPVAYPVPSQAVDAERAKPLRARSSRDASPRAPPV